MAALWYISIVLQFFFNKLLNGYEVDEFQNNCTIHH